MNVVVIGGGAAGFFTAINIAGKHSNAKVTILEKTGKVLSKVKVSGGGRCNVTNGRSQPSDLVKFYPRGQKKLHPVFKTFSTSDMVAWLEERGIQTKTEPDQRMFPVTDKSQTIIDCFLNECKKHNISIQTNCSLLSIQTKNESWLLETSQGPLSCDKVIFCSGSSPSSWNVLKNLGLELTNAVPSLFTFNIKDDRLKDLQGLSFNEVNVKITGKKLEENGPLLITHWGLSGPAILKLSAWGARDLNDCNYQFSIRVNYLGETKAEKALQQLRSYKESHPGRKIAKYPLWDLPKRFWEQMIQYCQIPESTSYSELSKKHINKLIEELCQGLYNVNGKSTFKEEFVTCGGVKLQEINLNSFESKKYPGLYLAGEVLDIDALTGGFNFQACWSAGWIISEHITKADATV